MRINYVECVARNWSGIPLVIALCMACGWNQSAWAQDAGKPQEIALADAPGPPTAGTVGIPTGPSVDLPDAPVPEFAPVSATDASIQAYSLRAPRDFSSSAAEAWSFPARPPNPEQVPLSQCPADTTHARECRVHWYPLLVSASLYDAFQDAGNLYTGYWYRYETTTGKWFDRWIDSAAGWRWNVWDDNNPYLDQYVGHSMMGSITNYMWIQNDPKAMTVEMGDPGYWRSRMRATLFTTAFSFQWKLGPFGEAAIGHNGDHYFGDNGSHRTNETGWVELVTTPVGGLLWTMAEDGLDKHLVKHLEQKPRGPVALLLISFLTPSKATANIFRWRPPWYRDGREVRANSFWSEPPGPGEVVAAESDATPRSEVGSPAPSVSGGVQAMRKPEALPVWPHPGGVHEFGAWWGLSLMSGHIWGYAKDVKYMPIDVNYSYLLVQGTKWNFRYAPELTALAMLDEPLPPNRNPETQRKRTYGSGLSPVGFRASFAPESRVQPFLSTDGGFIYFIDRVLSPQGSQFMYTIDFGGGLQIHRTNRQAISIGYRYQHLSNANISLHNPGTDTNVFYLAVSRFRTKGYR